MFLAHFCGPDGLSRPAQFGFISINSHKTEPSVNIVQSSTRGKQWVVCMIHVFRKARMAMGIKPHFQFY